MSEKLESKTPSDATACSASNEVRRMVFAFDDHGRQQEVRGIAARVKALEDALRGMRDYYRQHMISGVLYKQVEDALGEPNDHCPSVDEKGKAND